MNKAIEKLKEGLSGAENKGAKILVAVGLIGIGLIFLSTFWTGSGGSGETGNTSGEYTSTEYCEMLESRLTEIVKEVTGSENVQVMITLRSATEYVYASDIKTDTDTKTSGASDTAAEEQNTTEQNYITVEDANGNKVALLVTSFTPTIQGVVVVCDGGDNEAVQQKVEQAVKVVLGISARKVCVVGAYQ